MSTTANLQNTETAHGRANTTFPIQHDRAWSTPSPGEGSMPDMTSTPQTGPDFPGAYTYDPDPNTPDVDLSAAAKSAVSDAINTARENLPSLDQASSAVNAACEYLPNQENLKSATRSAIDAARQYLPKGVTAYLRAYIC